MGSEGVLWVLIMEDEISELFTNLCRVHFAGKRSANNILYNILWVKEDGRRPRILNPAGKRS